MHGAWCGAFIAPRMGSRNLLVTEKSPLKVKIYEAKAGFASKTAHKALPPTLSDPIIALR